MQLFSMRQKGQLDVFGLWGVLRGQLLTDDSFVYNRVLSRIKDSIQHLPEATEDDDEALLRVKVSFFELSTFCTRSVGQFNLGLMLKFQSLKRQRVHIMSFGISQMLSNGSACVSSVKSLFLD